MFGRNGAARHPPVGVVHRAAGGAGGGASSASLLGAPTLKLRGDYLAIVTLGFGEIIRDLHEQPERSDQHHQRPAGHHMIDPIRIFGVRSLASRARTLRVYIGGFSMPSVNAYYFLFLVLCVAAGVRLPPACSTRASAAPGSRSARTRSPPRRWASTPAT